MEQTDFKSNWEIPLFLWPATPERTQKAEKLRSTTELELKNWNNQAELDNNHHDIQKLNVRDHKLKKQEVRIQHIS